MAPEKQKNNLVTSGRMVDIIRGGKIPTQEELDQLEKNLDAFKKQYDDILATERAGGSPVSEPQPKTQIAQRVLNLNIDHLDNDAYKKRYKVIDDEVRELHKRGLYNPNSNEHTELNNRKESLFKNLLEDYKKTIYRFAKKEDLGINAAVANLSKMLSRITEDRKEIVNFSELEREFHRRTNTTISDFEKRLIGITNAFAKPSDFINIQGGAYSTYEFKRAEYICDAQDLLDTRTSYGSKYLECKNGFAHLTYYQSILEHQRVYYEVFYSEKTENKYIRNKTVSKESFSIATVAWRTAALSAGLSIMAMYVYRNLEVPDLYVYLLTIAAIFGVFCFVPTVAEEIKKKRAEQDCKAAKTTLAAEMREKSKRLIKEIPTSKDDINYVISASRTAYSAMCRFEEFLKMNTDYCSVPVEKHNIRLYKKYFWQSRSLTDAVLKYRADIAAAEAERKRAEERESLKKDIIDAIEQAFK